jgi:O-antigen/teichoic acid export membrane protein
LDLRISRRIIQNFSSITIFSILGQVVGIFTSVKVTQILGVTNYGLLAFAQSLVALFLVISNGGMRHVVVRNIVIDPVLGTIRSIFKTSLKIKLVVTFSSLILFSLYFKSVVLVNGYKDIYWFVILMICLGSFLDIIESIAAGIERMWQTAALSFFLNLLWCGILLLGNTDYFFLTSILVISLILRILHIIILSLWIYKLLPPVEKVHRENSNVSVTNFFKSFRPFYITAIFSAIQIQVPILFLQMNSSVNEVSYFSLSSKILGPFQLVLFTLLQTTYPYLVRLADRNINFFFESMQKYLRFFLFISVSIACTFSLMSKEVVMFIYGIEFISSVEVIELQVWYFVYLVIFSLLGLSLSSTSMEKNLSKLAISYALISVIIAYVFSFNGAKDLSFSYLLSATIAFSYHVYFVHKWSKGGFAFRTLFGSLLVLIMFPYGFPYCMKILDFTFVVRFSISVLLLCLCVFLSLSMFKTAFQYSQK